MSEKDGGSALPFTADGEYWIDREGQQRFGFQIMGGLTIRDWFAGQALASVADNAEETVDDIADWAYRLADAMLKRREK